MMLGDAPYLTNRSLIDQNSQRDSKVPADNSQYSSVSSSKRANIFGSKNGRKLSKVPDGDSQNLSKNGPDEDHRSRLPAHLVDFSLISQAENDRIANYIQRLSQMFVKECKSQPTQEYIMPLMQHFQNIEKNPNQKQQLMNLYLHNAKWNKMLFQHIHDSNSVMVNINIKESDKLPVKKSEGLTFHDLSLIEL